MSTLINRTYLSAIKIIPLSLLTIQVTLGPNSFNDPSKFWRCNASNGHMTEMLN